MNFFKNLPYQVKLISIYITTTVVGVILVLVAIYNASMELELRHKSENIYDVFNNRISKLALSLPQHVDIEKLNTLAKKITTDTYSVIAVPNGKVLEPVSLQDCNIQISKKRLSNDSVNNTYGVISEKSCTINWALIPIGKTDHQFLILYKFIKPNLKSLYHAYINRLIIPITFFIWLTVWGSLILGNLVKKLEIQKNEVEHLAMHDALTGLPNRNYFSDKMHDVLSFSKRENKNFVLALVDLNKFKEVNDNFGHNAGDELLKQVAQRFKNEIREYDIVARIGGDEFVLLLPNTGETTSKTILDRIYSSLIKEYSILGTDIVIDASIGVAYFPQHGTEFTDILNEADRAMYRAKHAGGGINISNI